MHWRRSSCQRKGTNIREYKKQLMWWKQGRDVPEDDPEWEILENAPRHSSKCEHRSPTHLMIKYLFASVSQSETKLSLVLDRWVAPRPTAQDKEGLSPLVPFSWSRTTVNRAPWCGSSGDPLQWGWCLIKPLAWTPSRPLTSTICGGSSSQNSSGLF